MNTGWNLVLQRIRRGKWFVLSLGVLAALIGGAVVVVQPPTYTTWATLTIGSPNRAPDQDGVLATGYVDVFNNPGYQAELKSAAQIPGDVTLRARTAAASPIIYIEASSQSRNEAVSAAGAAADSFKTQINAPLRATQEETIAALRKPFDDARQANGVVSEISLDQLQDEINQIRADTANQLMSMQKNFGLGERPGGSWLTVLFAFLGGLLVGCVVVTAWETVSRRVSTSAELVAKTGLSPIVDIPASDERTRDQRFRQLVNAVALASPACETVAVTSTVPSICSRQVAVELARGRAAQGVRTILINADLNARNGVGFGDVIADDSLALESVIKATSLANLWEIESGNISQEPFSVITRQRVSSLLARLGSRADCVIVSAPSVTQAPEAQILCAAVDGVLLVVDGKRARVADTAESVSLLEAGNATFIGSVLIEESSKSDGGTHSEVQGAQDSARYVGEVQDAVETVSIGGSGWLPPSHSA